MATERFIDIKIRSSGAEKNVKDLNRQMTNLGKAADKTVKILSQLTKIAAGVAVAILAIATATSTMIKSSADARRETEQLARLVKVSAEEFNALAFATKQYGVSAEQIADISKDIADRVGEFSAAGTGTFQDYADVLKLTAEEAVKTAKEFQFLSGPEVIQKMVNEMEKANVTGAQMTFVLESMGNDLSKLQPLFASNGAELNRLSGGFRSLNSELVITTQQSGELRIVSENFDLMAGSASAASTAISASLAPVLNDLFKNIIQDVPIATQAFIEFINAFKDASNINSIKAIDDQIQIMQGTLLELRNASFLGIDISQTQGTIDAIQRVQDKISELVTQRVALQNAPEISIPGAGVATPGTTGIKEDANQKKIDKLFEFFNDERLATQKHLQDLFDIEIGFKTAQEVDEENRFLANQARLQARFEQGLILIGSDELARQDLREEFNNAELAAVAAHEQALTDIQADESDERIALNQRDLQSKVSTFQGILGAAAAFGIKSEKLNKAVRIAQGALSAYQIFAATEAAAALALAQPPGPPSTIPFAASISAAGKIKAGAVLAGAVGGAFSSGGGGVSASRPSVPTVQQITPTPTAQELPQQTRVVDIRIDDNALLTGSMFKDAMNSIFESDTDIIVNITNQQAEAVRTGAI